MQTGNEKGQGAKRKARVQKKDECQGAKKKKECQGAKRRSQGAIQVK